jgi:hypothetical protein
MFEGLKSMTRRCSIGTAARLGIAADALALAAHEERAEAGAFHRLA